MTYYISREGRSLGPYTLDELRQYLATGRLLATDVAWTEGMSAWEPVAGLLEPSPYAPASPRRSGPLVPLLLAGGALVLGLAALVGFLAYGRYRERARAQLVHPTVGIDLSAPEVPPPPPHATEVPEPATKGAEPVVQVDFRQVKVRVQPPVPPYPPLARTAKVQGTVVVEFLVGTEGEVLTATAIEGPPLLRPTAERYARDWRFAPVLVNGAPCKARFRLTMPFRLR